jgi:hypothetical protein
MQAFDNADTAAWMVKVLHLESKLVVELHEPSFLALLNYEYHAYHLMCGCNV